VYGALDRIAPADFVEDTLAHDALARGDLDGAQHYATRMPANERRSDVLAQIAQARGDATQAFEYYFAADDVDALQRSIAALAVRDRPAALASEARVRARLIALGTHPDAVAESYLISGRLAVPLYGAKKALPYYQAALAIAPLNLTYVLETAYCALDAKDYELARTIFRSGLDVNPKSGDAFAGLGLVALRTGDRAQAQAYLARARAAEPNADAIPGLARLLQAKP